MAIDESAIPGIVREDAHRLQHRAGDYDPLMELIGDAPIVLLGEASHGTHEFYRARAQITRRLIEEKGFQAVAVEADWPDAYRLNRYVRGQGSDASAEQALGDFLRFPTWMWRNTEVVEFADWLRSHNLERSPTDRVGFYGLDLYSLYNSINAVIDYLEQVDHHAAEQARQRYACFDHSGEDAQSYGYGIRLGYRPSCEREAADQLLDLRFRAEEHLRGDGVVAADEQFQAEQNARLVRNAEAYYRGMFTGGRANTWNMRDSHMAETLNALLGHLSRRHPRPKVVVWEHNSHIGDARATEMAAHGEHNVGQLVRERHGDDAVLVGFTTHTGSVSAASDWGGAVERKSVRPSLEGSLERALHDSGVGEFLLSLRGTESAQALDGQLLERAIGVIYRPESERASHYFRAHVARQFDVLVHFDRTRALQPLEPTPAWERGEAPETYPFGV